MRARRETYRRTCVLIFLAFALDSQIIEWPEREVCARVCARARAGARSCACVRVRVHVHASLHFTASGPSQVYNSELRFFGTRVFILLFLILCGLMLLTILIALFSSSYEAIQAQQEIEWKTLRWWGMLAAAAASSASLCL